MLLTFRYSRWYYPMLAIMTSVLLSLGWLTKPLSFTLLFAFVPLLRLEASILFRVLPRPGRRFFKYAYLSMFVWNTLATWWTTNTIAAGIATAAGGVFAIIANSFLQCIPLMLFHYTKRVTNPRIGYFSLILYWIAFEYIHLNWDLSWPWLTLGNGFMFTHHWVQWYEYTGVLGGSLWILLANLFAFFALIRHRGIYSPSARAGADFYVILVTITPILFSYYLYHTEPLPAGNKQIEFVVIQPNIDPYKEKFEGTEDFIPFDQQVRRFIALSETKITDSTRFVIWPETAIDAAFWEETIEQEAVINQVKEFVRRHPHISLVTGVTSLRHFNSKEEAPITARFRSDLGYYEVYNTALWVQPEQPLSFYHKSKLVPGVEILPYPEVFGFLTELIFNLGGTSGGYGRQKERSIFKNAQGIGLAPAICYESIYGEFMTEYVRNGADFITIITNDGWWGNTPGHRQHLAFSSLRAIETRRCIARSANTGVSTFVDERGDRHQATSYWEEAVIRTSLPITNEITFYVQYGDYIGRFTAWVGLFMLLFALIKALSKRRSRRMHAVHK